MAEVQDSLVPSEGVSGQVQEAKPGLPSPSEEAAKKQSTNDGYYRQLAATVVVNLLALGAGTSFGWVAPVQKELMSEESPTGSPLSLPQVTFLFSSSMIGSLFGCLVSTWIMSKTSTKLCASLVAGFQVVGWVLILFPGFLAVLYIGRFLLGLSGCVGFLVASQYITNIASTAYRGSLLSWIMFFWNLGFVYSFALGTLVTYKVLTISCFVLPMIFLATFHFFPDSPVYLYSKKKRGKAEDSLMFFRGNNLKLVEEELSRLSVKTEDSQPSYKELFKRKAYKRVCEIGIVLNAFSGFNGYIPIVSFTQMILEASESSVSLTVVAPLLAATKLIVSYLSTLLIDRAGRRPLLFSSSAVMFVATFLLGSHYKLLQEELRYPFFGFVPALLLTLFIIGFCLGASVPNVLISEMLPSQIRGAGLSIIFVWATSVFLASAELYPVLLNFLGYPGIFWVYSANNFIVLMYAWFRIPESKGLSLDQITALLET